jgi:hypothetical protein
VTYQPVGAVLGGVLAPTQVQAVIDPVNTLLAGFGQVVSAPCSGALTLSTTSTDISGCSVTVTPAGNNAIAIAIATADFNVGVASGGLVLSCNLLVDGVLQGGGALASGATVTPQETHSFVWVVPLSGGSAHTLKLQGSKTAAAGTAAIIQTFTALVVVLLDVQ